MSVDGSDREDGADGTASPQSPSAALDRAGVAVAAAGPTAEGGGNNGGRPQHDEASEAPPPPPRTQARKRRRGTPPPSQPAGHAEDGWAGLTAAAGWEGGDGLPPPAMARQGADGGRSREPTRRPWTDR
jgi:hypothetical protein